MRGKFYILTPLILAVFLTSHFGPAAPAWAENGYFGGGDGLSAATAYIIEDAADLDAVRGDMGKFYKLDCDIDLTDYLSVGGIGYGKWGS
ncbi:MAG: hypothetical protein FWG09_06840, partial [Synergistaceae bacterium]|nr:hypothetical protein [Synergistaceae bacterium]